MFAGVKANSTSHSEKLVSALGGGTSILAVTFLTKIFVIQGWVDLSTSYFIVASMGASAVLLFAVPHGALSQPWALIGGHIVSAIIGVAAYNVFGDSLFAAGLAVGLAIGGMYYLRCIHPPGGATALTAVIGGSQVHDLGFWYVLVPIFLNALVIFLVAIVFNSLFSWRRYPSHVSNRLAEKRAPKAQNREIELTQEDFIAATQKLDSYVDITTDGIVELLELAKIHAEKNIVHPEHIVAGHAYSNGRLGMLWSVRQIVDEADVNLRTTRDQVIYKVVAGEGSYDTGICSREEFKQWARFEVIQKNDQWVKRDPE